MVIVLPFGAVVDGKGDEDYTTYLLSVLLSDNFFFVIDVQIFIQQITCFMSLQLTIWIQRY